MALKTLDSRSGAGPGAAGNRNAQTEQWLTDMGVEWEFLSAVPTINFDIERSLANQARLSSPVNEETVSRYREGLRNGAKFPPVLVQRLRSGLYLVLDGNHRVAAHHAEGKSIDVYVLSSPRPEILTMIMHEANTRHGLPTSQEDRLHAALFLVDQGFSQEEAARRLLLPVSTLRRRMLDQLASRRAAKVQIDPRAWEMLAEGARVRLASLGTDEVFEAAARLAVDARMKTDAIFKFVTEVNKQTSQSEQLALIALHREESEDAIRGAVVDGGRGKMGARSPKTRFNIVMGQAATMPDTATLVASIPVPEREAALEKVQTAMARLKELEEALVD